MEQLDLRQIIRIARRRAWIVLLLMLVAGGTAYYRSAQETPIYSAGATMIVNPGVNMDLSDYNAIFQTQELAQTYAALVATGPVLDRVANTLGVPFIESSVSASIVGDSQFLNVRVTDTDRDRAVLVANTVVTEFQGYMEERAANRADAVKGGLAAQITSLAGRVDEIDTQVTALRAGDNAADEAVQQQISDLTQERVNVSQSLTSLNTNAVTIDAQIMAGSAQIELVNPARGAGQISPIPQSWAMPNCWTEHWIPRCASRVRVGGSS